MAKIYESFNSEQALYDRVEQLRAQGVADYDMEIVSSHDLEGSYWDFDTVHREKFDETNRTGVEPTFGDRLKAFFTGDDPQDVALDKYHFDETRRSEALTHLRNGDYLLIFDNDGINSGVATDYDGKYDSAYAAGNYKYDDIDQDIRDRADLSDEEKIRLHEERLRVDKDRVQAGEVRVDKNVVTERQQIEVPVEKEEVVIERRKVNEKEVGDFDSTIDDEGTIHIPVHEERVNVTKENVVGEEIVIKKNVIKDTEKVDAEVRKEVIDIDEDANLKQEGILDDRDIDDKRI